MYNNQPAKYKSVEHFKAEMELESNYKNLISFMNEMEANSNDGRTTAYIHARRHSMTCLEKIIKNKAILGYIYEADAALLKEI